VLEKKGYTSVESKCFLQSGEKKGIEQLKGKTKLKRIFLIDDNNKEYKTLWKKDVLEWAKEWEVTGFGFSKTFIVVPNGLFQPNPNLTAQENGHTNVTDRFGETMIDDAHAAGMEVHVFSFRNEDKKLLFEYGQDPYNEYQKFLDLEIDGFFTDFPATANLFINGELGKNTRNDFAATSLNQLWLFLEHLFWKITW
jgi:glycerophosphoryl diester phosphodiesterase